MDNENREISNCKAADQEGNQDETTKLGKARIMVETNLAM